MRRAVLLAIPLACAACSKAPPLEIGTSAIAHPAGEHSDAGATLADEERDGELPARGDEEQRDAASSDEPEDALPFDPQTCPDLDVVIDVAEQGVYTAVDGVQAEVLQRPVFDESNRAPDPDADLPPPESWDRSELPAGACVVSLSSIQTDCYTHQATLAVYHPPDDAGVAVSQASYYARRFAEKVDLCDWPVPGCPSEQWGGPGGYWWYFTERASDTLFVICAPACERFLRAPITLHLRSTDEARICDMR